MADLPADLVPVNQPNDLVPVGDGAPAAAPVEQPGMVQSLWQGLLHGLGNPGAALRQMGARSPESLETPQQADTAIRQREQEYRGPYAPGPGQPLSPARAHPFAAGTGEFIGESLMTGPLGLLGRGASVLSTGLRSAGVGGAAAALNPVTSERDFWTEKATQTGLGAAAGGGTGVVGGALAPRVGVDATEMARRGINLTPGMRTGMQGTERTLQAFPILRGYIEGQVGRSVEDFNRAVVRQALEPIGAVMPRRVRAGHDMMNFMDNALDNAYNTVLPQLAPLNRQTVETALLNNPALAQFRSELSRDAADRLDRIIENRVLSRFDPNTGMMDGTVFKRVESDVRKRASSFSGTSDSELGQALTMVNATIRDELANANAGTPMAQYLQNINHAWAMSTRVREAGTRRAESGSVFTPADLLAASRSGDNSVNHAVFNRGDALFQDFGEMANRVMGRSLKPYADISGPSAVAGAIPGLAGRLLYPALEAQRQPWIGTTVRATAPAAGGAAADLTAPRERRPRTSTAGP